MDEIVCLAQSLIPLYNDPAVSNSLTFRNKNTENNSNKRERNFGAKVTLNYNKRIKSTTKNIENFGTFRTYSYLRMMKNNLDLKNLTIRNCKRNSNFDFENLDELNILNFDNCNEVIKYQNDNDFGNTSSLENEINLNCNEIDWKENVTRELNSLDKYNATLQYSEMNSGNRRTHYPNTLYDNKNDATSNYNNDNRDNKYYITKNKNLKKTNIKDTKIVKSKSFSCDDFFLNIAYSLDHLIATSASLLGITERTYAPPVAKNNNDNKNAQELDGRNNYLAADVVRNQVDIKDVQKKEEMKMNENYRNENVIENVREKERQKESERERERERKEANDKREKEEREKEKEKERRKKIEKEKERENIRINIRKKVKEDKKKDTFDFLSRFGTAIVVKISGSTLRNSVNMDESEILEKYVAFLLFKSVYFVFFYFFMSFFVAFFSLLFCAIDDHRLITTAQITLDIAGK